MYRKTPYVIVSFLAIILLSGIFSMLESAKAGRTGQNPEEQKYTRPKPTKPITPAIPSVNRYQDDKVFLENADSLYRPGEESEEKQIVKGNVKFRQGGMWMYCDSAYYFPTRNSMDAFGHVVMEQGDTLFVYADKLYYDGSMRHATLTRGPSQGEVILKNREVTLTTDSLDYDLLTDRGWYTVGGKLDDGVNVLTSQYGEYSPATKIADFSTDVLLVNNRDGYRMRTEKLIYNTSTNIADINTETIIESENDTILTRSGQYNTTSDNAILTSRSTILHRDSAGNVTTLEGDTLIYDKQRHISEARMRDKPMVLTDTARKMILIGGFGLYNDSTRESTATRYPLLIEYSRPDTLFLRADTLLTFMRIEKVWPDSLTHGRSAERRQWLASFESPEEIADWLSADLTIMPPTVPEPGQWIRDAEADSIRAAEAQRKAEEAERAEAEARARAEAEAETAALAENESAATDKTEELIRKSEAPEESGEEENAEETMEDGKAITSAIARSLRKNHEESDSVIEPPELSLSMADTIPIKDKGPRLDALGRDSAFMVDKEFYAAKAIGKARFFKTDLQGIADTILYHQYDSMLYLRRKPVVWSGERQISGDSIKVHMIDSVADWAHLPAGGLVVEHIDEEFYNQLSGSDIKAFLKDNELRHLIVDGNVEAIFLPMENDSTYNKIVYAESSYLTVDMDGKTMNKLKMWPDVEGTVKPLFLAKKNDDKYLRVFGGPRGWLEALRPVRRWYGDRLKWEDELGEVPEELIDYFGP